MKNIQLILLDSQGEPVHFRDVPCYVTLISGRNEVFCVLQF